MILWLLRLNGLFLCLWSLDEWSLDHLVASGALIIL